MALIKCPECGKEISDTAKSCPNCGHKTKKLDKRIIIAIVSIITTIVIATVASITVMSNINKRPSGISDSMYADAKTVIKISDEVLTGTINNKDAIVKINKIQENKEIADINDEKIYNYIIKVRMSMAVGSTESIKSARNELADNINYN